MYWVARKAVIWSIVTVGFAAAAVVMGQGRGAQGAPGGATSTPPPAAAAPAAAPADDGFPAGDSKAFVIANCNGCHGLDQIQSAKHDLAGWTETLGHMVTYGAPLTDAQVPTVAAYLAKSFPAQGTPPATATPPAAATPGADAPKPGDKPEDKKEDPDVAGERILNTACTTCHDLGPVQRRADDRNSWESIVYGMVGNGADVKDAEIPVLVDYLVKYYGPPKDDPKAPAAPGAPAAPAATPAPPARGAAPAGR